MSDVAEKWGIEVASRGFAQVPNYLLLLNQFLSPENRLSPTELMVLVQLAGSWWKKGEMPFPSMTTLATRCGVSPRQIQRAINRLEGLGLVRRVNRRQQGIISSNAYDLAPLANLLGEVAKAFPNQFPRNVDRATVERINRALKQTAPSEGAAAEMTAEESEHAYEALPEGVLSPGFKVKRIVKAKPVKRKLVRPKGWGPPAS